MTCIEMIRLRAAGKADRNQAMSVCREILRSNSSEQPRYTSLLTNIMLETDLCVFICWDRFHDSHRESLLGQQIEKAISGFGLLNHSLWSSNDTFSLTNHMENERGAVEFDTKWLKDATPS